MVRRLGKETGRQLELPLRPRTEQLSLFDPDLVKRLQRQLQQSLEQQKPPPAPVDQSKPATLGEVLARINHAGRQRPPIILRITYSGKERHVEPYSFRYRDRDNPHIPQLMAFELEDGKTKSFKLLSLLQGDIQFTDRTFNPRWPLEF
jgi:hypothetical protein